ncbi:MAG: hypothetical protein V3T83_17365 [Acidobacteriota bacterium]
MIDYLSPFNLSFGNLNIAEDFQLFLYPTEFARIDENRSRLSVPYQEQRALGRMNPADRIRDVGFKLCKRLAVLIALNVRNAHCPILHCSVRVGNRVGNGGGKLEGAEDPLAAASEIQSFLTQGQADLVFFQSAWSAVMKSQPSCWASTTKTAS